MKEMKPMQKKMLELMKGWLNKSNILNVSLKENVYGHDVNIELLADDLYITIRVWRVCGMDFVAKQIKDNLKLISVKKRRDYKKLGKVSKLISVFESYDNADFEQFNDNVNDLFTSEFISDVCSFLQK